MSGMHAENEDADDPVNRIILSYIEGIESGHPLDQQELLARHPEHALELAEFFSGKEQFDQAAQPFRLDAGMSVQSMAASSDASSHSLSPDLSLGNQTPFSQRATSSGERVRYFGEYELVEKIAHGGMGVVYKARQVRLNRVVALKMILAGQFASAEDVKRFQVEAENAARLDHPGIVSVYEVGKYKGQHYFTMKFVEGGSLCGQGAVFAQAPRKAATLIALVSRAVHYGHQRGILHRDIKPGNILLDKNGQPQITDFGLARQLRQEGHAPDLTLTGAIVGSPCYMSPEQARGEKGLTVAADVYALGAVLHELITGRPPFRSETVLETLRLVRDQPAAHPSTLNPKVDRDLATVCLKCLEKEPQRRYASAEALADELDRWLAGEPVQARPVGGPERIWRWCRRKPGLAALGALAASGILATIVMLSVALIFMGKSRDNNARLAAARKLLAEQEKQRSSETQSHLARLEFERALTQCQTTDAAEGVLWLAKALEEAEKADDPELQRSIRLQLEGWAGSVHRLEMIRSWPQIVLGPIVLSADGSRCLIPDNNEEGTIRVCDVSTLAPVGVPIRWTHGSYDSVLSPDGQMVVLLEDATAQSPAGARIFNVNDGSPAGTLFSPVAFSVMAFRPDGKAAVTIDEAGVMQIWDLATGMPIGPKLDTRLADGQVHWDRLAFSSGGKQVVAAGEGIVRIWYTDGWYSPGTALRRELPANALAISHDGTLVLITEGAHILRWRPNSGRIEDAPLDHGAVVTAVALNSDDTLALTGGADHMVRLWDLHSGRQVGAAMRSADEIQAVAFAAGGTIGVAANDKEVRAWKLRNETNWMPADPDVQAITRLSPDGTHVAAKEYRKVRLWDVTAGTQINLDFFDAYATIFDGTGKRLLVINGSCAAQWYDVASGRSVGLLITLEGHPPGEARLDGAAVSEDGEILIMGMGNETRAWNLTTGQRVGQTLLARQLLAISPDGRLVAVSEARNGGAVVQIRRAPSWEPIGPSLLNSSGVQTARFSNDSRWLVTGGESGRVWDVNRGRQLGQLIPQRHLENIAPLEILAVSSDLSKILTQFDERAVVWETRTWKPIGVGWDRPAIGFTPGGTGLVFAKADGSIATARMAPLNVSAARAMLWLQTVTGLELDSDGIVRLDDSRPAGSTAMEQRLGLLARLGGPPPGEGLPTFAEGPTLNLIRSIPQHEPGATSAAHLTDQQVPATGPAGWPRAEWRVWGGSPARNAVSSEAYAPIRWDVERGDNILWSADLGTTSRGDPIIADGVVYVGTNNELNREPKHTDAKGSPIDGAVLMAFDAESGRFLWQRFSAKLPSGRVNDWPNQGLCSPVYVEDGRLWYATNRCEVVCLDVSRGRRQESEPNVLWSVDMIKQLGVFPHNMTRTSIVSYKDYIYVMTANGVDDTHKHVVAPDAPSLVCFDKNTGRVVWSDNSPGKNILHSQWAHVALAQVNGRMLVIAPMGDGWVRAFEAETGKLVWKFDGNPKESVYPGTRNEILAAPTIVVNRMYIGMGQDPEHGEGPGDFWCVRIDMEGDISAQLAADRDMPPGGELLTDAASRSRQMIKLNPNSGVIWHAGSGNPMRATPIMLRMHRTISTAVVYRGLVFAPDFAGFLHCFDARTGRQYWSADLESSIWTSPLAADGKIYLADEDGTMHIFLAGNRMRKIADNALGAQAYTSPVFINHTLYVMRRDKLLAIRHGTTEN
jgi:outer membrane protein assembly factor BamB/WD40 repeat protein/tRNA A-37 threonylcarbamoyl transferase component Bud32